MDQESIERNADRPLAERLPSQADSIVIIERNASALAWTQT